MKWLTREEILTAARAGEREAIACSLEHWKQLAAAEPEELVRALETGETGHGEVYCALCQRHLADASTTCSQCALGSAHLSCWQDQSAYRLATEALGLWAYCRRYRLRASVDGAWQAWQRAARRMVEVLRELLEAHPAVPQSASVSSVDKSDSGGRGR